MKKAHVIFLLFCVFILPAFARTQVENRMNLQNLLAERAKNFSVYASSIQKRSGIFGNKSKNDLEKSNEVLIDIVTLDNEIMDALNESLNYKTFERTTDNYSARDCEMKLQQSMMVTDTLMKQINLLESKIKNPGASSSVYKILFYLVLAVSAVLVWKMKRPRSVG